MNIVRNKDDLVTKIKENITMRRKHVHYFLLLSSYWPHHQDKYVDINYRYEGKCGELKNKTTICGAKY